MHNNGVITRQICASETVGEYEHEPVSFLYTRINRGSRPDYGEETIYLTTVPDEPLLHAEVTAEPTAIALGDSTLLAVVATGGTAPYEYLWYSAPDGTIPYDQLDHDTVWAKPDVTTVFYAVATDDVGDVETDSVTVTVGFSASFTMEPDTIDVGGTSQLQAVAVGGRQPYDSYSWVPLSALDNSSIPNPQASPVNTTLYQVAVVDADGLMATAADTLFVRMETEATADPTEIPLGDSTLLVASWEGGAAPYAYSWSPPGTINEPTGSNVLETTAASYAWPTDNTSYVVTVTDYYGLQAVDTVEVAVNGGTSLDACFTWEPATPPDANDGEVVNFYPQCSQGDIVAWVWWFGFDEGEPGPYSDSLDHERPQDIMFYEGTYVIRLKVYDSQGDSDEMLDTIIVIP